MLRIRFSRTGKKKQASYRVVVADQQRAVTAKFKEILGWYNPHTKELNINKEKTEGWLEKGASPSNSVAVLLKKHGVKLPKWVEIVEKKKQPKKAAKEEKKEAPKQIKEEKPSETVPENITEEEVAKEEVSETVEEPKEENSEEKSE